MKEVALNDLLLGTMSHCSPQYFSECDTITTCSCHWTLWLGFGLVPYLHCQDFASPRQLPKQTLTILCPSPPHNGAFFSHNAVTKVRKVTAADVTLRSQGPFVSPGLLRGTLAGCEPLISPPTARHCLCVWHHNSCSPCLDVMVKRNTVRYSTNGWGMTSILNQSRLRGSYPLRRRIASFPLTWLEWSASQ